MADIDPQRLNRGYSLREIIIVGGATILFMLTLMALATLVGGYAAPDAEMPAENVQNRLTLPIIIHLATVIPAIPLGAVVLYRRKGDATHKLLGRIWATLMMITAIASFWIGRPGTGIAGTGYSFIHIFAVITVVSIPLAIWNARQGNIEGHLRAMQGPYIGLVIAGLFAFIPGRILGTLAFG